MAQLSDETLRAEVSRALKLCLSANAEERKQACDILAIHESEPSFLLVLLHIFAEQRRTDPVLALQTLIYLKNTVSRAWPSLRSKEQRNVQPAGTIGETY